MALQLSFLVTQSDDCKTITFQETTGTYNSASNIGGWGAPNPLISAALTATVAFSKRNSDGTFTTYNLVNVFPPLPSDSLGQVTITANDIGFALNSQIPDGIYQLTYLVTGTGFVAIVSQYVYLTCGIECCWKQMANNVAACSCGCEPLEDKFTDLSLDFRLLSAAIDKGDLTVIQGWIDSITKNCTNCGCNCNGN